MTRMRARPGIVLPTVLLVLLIIELLAAGTLALAYTQHQLARERVNALRAQLAARSGTADLASKWVDGHYQTVTPGTQLFAVSNALDAHSRYSTMLERLSPSLFLVHSQGAAGPLAGEARARAGQLVAVTDVNLMAAQFEAAFTAAGGVQLAGAASITADQAMLPPLGWSAADCATWLGLPVAPPALLVDDARTVTAAPTALISGQPPVVQQPGLAARPFNQLGALDFTALQAIADRIESGSMALAAVAVMGNCIESSPGNWGAPLDQTHPCAQYFPLIFAPGSLTITGGAGQGILVVDGDLTLANGVQFIGVVLVRGRITAGANAVITGAAQAGSPTPSLLLGGSVIRCSCALSRALTRAPAFNRSIPRTPRTWIPLY